MKITKYKYVKTKQEDFEIVLPEEPFAWQGHNYRVLHIVVPQFTTWLVEREKKKKGSKRFNKVKKNLGKTYNRLRNTKNDYLHKESLKLVRDNKEGIIGLGDINIKSIIDKCKANTKQM